MGFSLPHLPHPSVESSIKKKEKEELLEEGMDILVKDVWGKEPKGQWVVSKALSGGQWSGGRKGYMRGWQRGIRAIDSDEVALVHAPSADPAQLWPRTGEVLNGSFL